MAENKRLKVLWIAPGMVGEGCTLFRSKEGPSGGWTRALWKRLIERNDLELSVAAPLTSEGEPIREGSDSALYVALPPVGELPCKPEALRGTKKVFRELRNRFRPDVIHVHGTEYPYGGEWVHEFGPEGVVVSIQGLLSVISRYYLGGIPAGDFPLTLRDFLKRDTPARQAHKFILRGEEERELLRKIQFVIGRTSWDRAHTMSVNPSLTYFYGGETLRESFYQNSWSYRNCEPHTIFISQGMYPLKGLHKVIEALPAVASHFPNVKVRVAGTNPIGASRLRIGGYGAYLKRLIKRLGVGDKIEFVGLLNEEEMTREFLRANLFVLPSSIENSPNSLGEAQILGMPYLASYVGGTPDLCRDNQDALYRFEETEMLADKICDIFELGDKFVSKKAPDELYDPDINIRDLIETYRNVSQSGDNQRS